MTFRETVAERRRVPVRMNLAELNRVLDACLDGGAGSRRAEPDLARAARAIERRRDARLRAVQRAGRG